MAQSTGWLYLKLWGACSLSGPAVCLTVCERWNTRCDSGDRREREEVRASLQRSEGSVAREHTEQRDIVLDFLEQDDRSDGANKQRKTCDGFDEL